MGEFTNEVYEALNRYFCTLTKTGYKSYTEVNQLLILTFMEELLYGPLSAYITEDDYKIITNSLDCLYGSCMIPYPVYKESFSNVVPKLPDKYRITENDILRISESDDLRVK